jgi:hypothetical protein
MPIETAQVLNRVYLVQLLNNPWVRYLIADDDFIATDLEWAGHRFERRTTYGFRYRKTSTR